MEHYNQFIDRLAEWFMMLFFDPAYHYSHDESTSDFKVRKRLKIYKSLQSTKQVIESVVKSRVNRWFNLYLKPLVRIELLKHLEVQKQAFQFAVKHLSVQLIH